ncbi:MAG: tyrosine-type recombinase/integrase [Eubacteriales bacterium]|nr:tyrosine-type recombinase/integrase [Eubacteriales bacterium]
MEKRVTYHEQRDIEYTVRLRNVLSTMPEFARDFFRASNTSRSTATTCRYAYCVRIFMEFLIQSNPSYKDKTIKDLTLEDMEKVTALDLEEYMDYLKAYKPSETDAYITNGEKGIKQKMSALRVFYSYFYKREMIVNNPTALIEMPKLHEKEIIRLDSDEVAELLDLIEHCGDDMNPHQRRYWEKTKNRDVAIITLLLGTGIRVSECVGLDVEDVDFKNNGIKVFRKGGNEMMVYFGEEVEHALRTYMEGDRAAITPIQGHEHALFYSSQRRRIGVKAVENLVQKYTSQITTTKKITPHKLRSTYGTALYQETGDIYLVADVLGHRDVNTTKRHYAAMSDARRRKAAKAVHLRED